MSRSSASRTRRHTHRRSFGCVRGVVLGLVALFTSGCVPVVTPVGDIEKAEPNEKLVGRWNQGESSFLLVDRPEVKGHPKGLMRARGYGFGDDPAKKDPNQTHWFFTATAGKATYVNVLVSASGGDPDLAKEGAYARWKKESRYWVIRFAFAGDELTLVSGDWEGRRERLDAQKFKQDRLGYYDVPADKLAKVLEQELGGGPEGAGNSKLTRAKGR